MTTIVEFLTARLDEDEAVANATTSVPVAGRWKAARDKHAVDDAPLYLVQGDEAEEPGIEDYSYNSPIIAYSAEWQTEAEANLRHIARHDPARVLAEVAAKRAIIEWHAVRRTATDARDPEGRATVNICWCGYDQPCATIRHLAAPYADHPDYDPAWRVE